MYRHELLEIGQWVCPRRAILYQKVEIFDILGVGFPPLHRLRWNFAQPSEPTWPSVLPSFTWIGATGRPCGAKNLIFGERVNLIPAACASCNPAGKKRGAQDSVDFGAISLVSHALKIVLKILTRRLESTTESYLGKDQFDFSKGRGTKYATAALCVLYERNYRIQQ